MTCTCWRVLYVWGYTAQFEKSCSAILWIQWASRFFTGSLFLSGLQLPAHAHSCDTCQPRLSPTCLHNMPWICWYHTGQIGTPIP